MSNSHPYSNLPKQAFWRTAVAELNPLAMKDLWQPRFSITKSTAIVTCGSCFAQHIGPALLRRGYHWLETEPAPRFLPQAKQCAYGYGAFSFRSGNLYTPLQLKQWVEWALGHTAMPEEVWAVDGRFYDPFRPTLEPMGFASAEEVYGLRRVTCDAIRKAIEQAELWVFTLGLTEAWRHRQLGYVYPVCPGTVSGEYQAKQHQFHNFRYPELYQTLIETLSMIRQLNSRMQFLFTVSPVPLTATASPNHVLIATEYSKSTLRAVAEDLKLDMEGVDYFPSYEMITAPPFRGIFYESNLRQVSAQGVEFVMNNFFNALTHADEKEANVSADLILPSQIEKVDVDCEEALLDAYAKVNS